MGIRSTNTTQSFGSDFYRSGIDATDPYIPPPPSYVDDVFSTSLYSGNNGGAAVGQSINNGIDLAGEGGLVWLKKRTNNTSSPTAHLLYDTVRWSSNQNTRLKLDQYAGPPAGEQSGYANDFDGFDSDGFDVKFGMNVTGDDYVSWSFRKQEGFFNVVEYTSTTVANVTIPHGLGSIPGMAIIKNLDRASDWQIWHRSMSSSGIGITFGTDIAFSNANIENTAPDSTNFYAKNPGYDANAITSSLGQRYIAYFFAHDDQRFGTNGNEAIIKCGGYTGNDTSGNSEGNHQDLGFEPQFLMIKNISRNTDPYTGWHMFDSMRGVAYGKGTYSPNGNDYYLLANSDSVEQFDAIINFTPTGFSLTNSGYSINSGGDDYIYIAIRRPNRPKTVGTDVFAINTRNGTGSNTSITNIGFNPDLVISKTRTSSTQNNAAFWYDRVRGNFKNLKSGGSNATSAESGTTTGMEISGTSDGTVDIVQLNNINRNGDTNVDWIFRRAPGFFDIVAFEGTGSNQDVSHNLQAVPELMIVKYRDNGNGSGSDPAYPWTVYHSELGSGKYLKLNNQGQQNNNGQWNGDPTDAVIKLGTNGYTNYNGWSFVAYLFASLPGVSKIGTYSVASGTSVDKNIDCGFSSPARFVMIKRYDSGMTAAGQGNWGIWDTARGIGTGNDNYLYLNLDNAEVTGFNDISEYASGFTVNAEGTSTSGWWNVSNASYIYLAIA